MLAIHFCSDREETIAVLSELLATVESRVRHRQFVVGADAARIFWVNPVADLRAMNSVEEWAERPREGAIIREHVSQELNLPTIELEIPPVCDAMLPTLSARLQALVETVQARRSS